MGLLQNEKVRNHAHFSLHLFYHPKCSRKWLLKRNPQGFLHQITALLTEGETSITALHSKATTFILYSLLFFLYSIFLILFVLFPKIRTNYNQSEKRTEIVMTDCKRYCLIFLIGAAGYCLLEILWRGHTHPSMAVVGGICFSLIRIINSRFRAKSYFFRALLCCGAISAVELLSGILLNIVFDLAVWDYSRQPLNFLGQICPLYCMLWFFLSLVILFFGNKFPLFSS